MDLEYLHEQIKKNLLAKCDRIPEKVINQYIFFTCWGANWIKIGNKDLDFYVLGLCEKNTNEFYYFGCDKDYNIYWRRFNPHYIKNKERFNEYITTSKGAESLSKESDDIWKIIKNNVKEFFVKYKDLFKLIDFPDHLYEDVNIVFDNHETNNNIK